MSAKSLLPCKVTYSRFWGTQHKHLWWRDIILPTTVSHPLICLSHSVATFLLSIYLFGSDHGMDLLTLSPGNNLSLLLLYQVSTSYLSTLIPPWLSSFNLITASSLSHLSNELIFKFNLSFNYPLSIMNYQSSSSIFAYVSHMWTFFLNSTNKFNKHSRLPAMCPILSHTWVRQRVDDTSQ